MAQAEYDRYLGNDEIQEYTSQESLSEKFQKVYNTFVDHDVKTFKEQIKEMDTNNFAKFIIHVLGEMNVDPREVVRTLRTIVD